MLPLKLKPQKLFKLKRIGKDNDGGYLVCEQSLEQSKVLLSFGISDDFSFEEKFTKFNNSKVYAFDPTSTNFFLIKSIIKQILKFQFICFYKKTLNFLKFIFFFKQQGNTLIKKKIGKGGSLRFESITFKEVLRVCNEKSDIFLKIDIEGSEYRILNEIIENSEILTGLAIEFHDSDINIDKILYFVNNLRLKLVHIHPNNFSEIGINNIPSTLELSFSKNPKVKDEDVNFPHILDQKNDPNTDEIKLIFDENL